MTEMKTTLDKTNNGWLVITAENISEQEHMVLKSIQKWKRDRK